MEGPVSPMRGLIVARHFYLLATRRFCARKKTSPMSASPRSRKNFHRRRRANISPERSLLICRGGKTTAPRRFDFSHRQKPKLSPEAEAPPLPHLSLPRIFASALLVISDSGANLRRFHRLCRVLRPFSVVLHKITILPRWIRHLHTKCRATLSIQTPVSMYICSILSSPLS